MALKNNYLKATKQELLDMLPGRTPLAIYNKALTMGLRGRRKMLGIIYYEKDRPDANLNNHNNKVPQHAAHELIRIVVTNVASFYGMNWRRFMTKDNYCPKDYARDMAVYLVYKHTYYPPGWRGDICRYSTIADWLGMKHNVVAMCIKRAHGSRAMLNRAKEMIQRVQKEVEMLIQKINTDAVCH